MKKIILVVFALFISFPLIGQTLNKYKYVIIPKRLDFVKKDDQYSTSTLTRHLFKQEGFEVFYDNEVLPEEYINDPCKGLLVSVDNLSGLLTTRIIISLKNCYKEQVFVSQEGKSKVKEYRKAYHEAIRQAFKSVEFLGYYYEEPKEKPATDVAVEEKQETKIVEDNGPFEEVVVEQITSEVEVAEPAVVEKVQKTVEKVPTKKETLAFNGDILYAQAIDGGFQLVNSKPEIVAKIFKTSDVDSFLMDSDLFKGLLKKENGEWFIEAIENGKVVKAKVNIKF
ncbi:hypothetical protein [Spongiivirga citrea]|uniref:Uncharacterized protein n=1 Tax=Spongiivirga citrea TaxID=1481457 RepID=A0A6M0CLC0_9FLAO|nr:hypothetical protein [Spongiivirga citrea]NER16217.1 hypothetical protein [Spongiivirga citrea]